MKIFLAKKYNFSGVQVFTTGNTFISSGIFVPVQENYFDNAHVDCTNCDKFCTLLKERFQPKLCDEENPGLEIRLTLNPTTMTFSARTDGDILENLARLQERTCTITQIESGRCGPSKLTSQKTEIGTEKGKHFSEGKMNSPTEWINFFLNSKAQDSIRGYVSVILGMENMLRTEVPPQLTENSNLVSMNMSILEKQISTDLILTSENGTKFPCHKNFLAVYSAIFEAMLKGKNFVEGETGTIVLDDMTESGVKAFLKFMYYRDTEDPTNNPSVAMELLKCGNKYGIEILVHSMSEMLLGKANDWFVLSTAMRLFYYGCQVDKGQSEFKRKAIQILRLKSITEVETSVDYNQLFSKNAEAAKELCTTLLSQLSLSK